MTTPADRMFALVEWKPLPRVALSTINQGVPYATHQGLLKVGNVPIRCYQLSDGRRVLDGEDLTAFFEGGKR